MPEENGIQTKPVAESQPATPEPTTPAETSATAEATEAKAEGKTEEVKTEEKPEAEAKEESASESLLSETEEEAEQESDVPENYEFTTPEGVELDKGMLEDFAPLAKELSLSQENAQKLVDLVATKSQEAAEVQRKQEAQMISDWQKEITSDPGHKELLSAAKMTVSKFGKDNPEFEKLTKSWLGSHPGFVKFLASIGTHLKEADMDTGSVGSSGGAQTLGSILYPDMGKKK